MTGTHQDRSDHERRPELHMALDAFTELVALSLEEVTTETALQKVVRVARQTVPRAAAVSVTMLQDGKPSTAAFTGQLARDLDESQYARGYGPCLDAAVGGGVCRIVDTRREPRWADYAREAASAGCLSSVSVPLPGNGTVSGALNVYATEPDALDDDACEIARAFASYAGVAVGNLTRYASARREAEELQRAMASRAVIDQAKGLLMGAHRCDADAAFDLLVQMSQRANVKLRDVAADLVRRAALPD